MSFYLKYRPQTIDELDLLGVRDTFNQIIASNKLSHAYLFTGPRGAGKTSSARILARVANCEKNKDNLGEPCNKCVACKEILGGGALDVIEIDAASNRGIDDIRELKEKIRLAPTSLKYKVYIIDEVHMLTTEAFNALLKTLEEPPAHTLFILCTTELHKVPETIVSRCVKVNFYKASPAELARSFARVLLGEGTVLSDEILAYVGSHVDGSFRDGVKLLEQILTFGSEVTISQVEKIMSGGVGYKSEDWVAAMLAKDTLLSLQLLRQASDGGIDLTYFVVSAMQTIRNGLLAPYKLAESTLTIDPGEGIKLVYILDKTARAIGSAPLPELLLEAMIIEWSTPQSSNAGGQASSTATNAGGQAGRQTSKPDIQKPSAPASQPSSKPIEKVVEAVEVEVYKDQIMDGAQLRSLWRKLVSIIPESQYSLEALLSKANPMRVEGRNLIVSVAYDFHKSQLETKRFRDNIETLVKQVYGMPLIVVYEVSKGGTIVEAADELVDAAQEIFVS